MGLDDIGTQRDRLLVCNSSFRPALEYLEDTAQVVMRFDTVRIDVQRLALNRLRIGEPIHPVQHDAKVVARLRVIGTQR